MLDGERCLRCRNHFKFEDLTLGPGGYSLCRECAPRLDPKEPPRACPKDGGRMKKEVVGNLVLIDRCASCGGVWFDGDEIEVVRLLAKHSDEEAARQLMWVALLGII